MKIQKNTPPLLKAISEISDPKLQEALLTILAYKKHLKNTKKEGEQNPIYKNISQFDGFLSRIVEHASQTYSPVLKIGSEAHDEEKKRLKKKYSSLSKIELIEKLVESVIAAKQMAEIAKRYKADAEELANVSVPKFIKETRSVINRTAGREKRYKNNNEYLVACLEDLKRQRNKALQDSDYLKFQTIVTVSPPPFKSKTRESAEEKNLAFGDRKASLKDKRVVRKAHNGWSPTTIREFWESQTKLKATTKKSASLKS